MKLGRSILVVCSAALLGLSSLAWASPATAAKAPATVTVSSTVSLFDVQVSYSINRKASSITSQTCTLTNLDTLQSSPASCDTSPNKGSNGNSSEFGVGLRIPTPAHYSFQVSATIVGSTAASTGSTSFTIVPGPAVRFQVSGLRDETTYQNFPSQTFTVDALDQYGNVATGYTGTVHFTGGDNLYIGKTDVLPADSTLVNGHGVFSMNPGYLQSDCHYADIADCGNYERVTATDTVDASITGYQRFKTDIIISIPNYYYTPDSGVCTTCVVDPSGTIQIDTSKPVTGTVLDLTSTTVTIQLAGTTTTGASFTQNVVTTSMVGATSGSALDGNIVVPTVGQAVSVDLTVTGGSYGDMSFNNVTVNDPYGNTTNTTTTLATQAYMTGYYPALCGTGYCS